jgi:hypothetical protein
MGEWAEKQVTAPFNMFDFDNLNGERQANASDRRPGGSGLLHFHRDRRYTDVAARAR